MCLGELKRKERDAPGTEQESGLMRAERCGANRTPGSGGCDGQRGGLSTGEMLWGTNQRMRWNDDILGEAAGEIDSSSRTASGDRDATVLTNRGGSVG